MVRVGRLEVSLSEKKNWHCWFSFAYCNSKPLSATPPCHQRRAAFETSQLTQFNWVEEVLLCAVQLNAVGWLFQVSVVAFQAAPTTFAITGTPKPPPYCEL